MNMYTDGALAYERSICQAHETDQGADPRC